jgi:hypothetical protein
MISIGEEESQVGQVVGQLPLRLGGLFVQSVARRLGVCGTRTRLRFSTPPAPRSCLEFSRRHPSTRHGAFQAERASSDVQDGALRATNSNRAGENLARRWPPKPCKAHARPPPHLAGGRRRRRRSGGPDGDAQRRGRHAGDKYLLDRRALRAYGNARGRGIDRRTGRRRHLSVRQSRGRRGSRPSPG